MTEQSDKDKKPTSTLTISPKSKLQLSRPVDPSQIKPGLLHSRSKTVTVEVKKSRSFNREALKTPDQSTEIVAQQVEVKAKPEITPSHFEEQHADNLTNHERAARLNALKHASEKSTYKSLLKETERRTPVVEEEHEAALDEIEQKETPVVAQIQEVQPAPQEPLKANVQVETKLEKPVVEQKVHDKPVHHHHADFAKAKEKSIAEDEEVIAKKRGHHSGAKQPVTPVKVVKPDLTKANVKGKLADNTRRQTNKITVTHLSDDDDAVRSRSYASIKRAREKAKRNNHDYNDGEKIVREIILPEVITPQELANRMAEKSALVIKELMKLGVMAAMNQTIDADTAELVATSLGHKVKRVTENEVENILIETDNTEETLVRRAPVVTIMGHVDHGKTTLLDALRSTDVASTEAGGITQHIGAYRVRLATGEFITFLDTPGHEAFTAMRARGAKVTDIVILVVAADDGIMAQTIEAANHAKAAELPIIVAINKIDRPGSDPQRVRHELLNHGLIAEEFGGDIMVVEVSAKAKINLEKLEEAILLQAEVLDLKANPDRAAIGAVLESKIAKGRGVVASVLIQKGTLKVGDIIVAGAAFGKVRAMTDDKGANVIEATPSMAVEVQGLDTAPEAGDVFTVVPSEKQAREISEYREKRMRELRTARAHKSQFEDIFKRTAQNQIKELPVVLKADVHGSVDAISSSLSRVVNEEVRVKILHAAVGGITESDVILAKASNAIVIGFNVRATSQAKTLAENEGVDIRYYSVIYNLMDEMKAALSGMLSPVLSEVCLGSAEIRQIFEVSKIGKIAGCLVLNGLIKRHAKARLLRDNIVIHEGKIKTLRRFKDDAKEVKEGFECGIMLENYDDIKEKDVIEAFEIVEEKQKL